MSAASIFDSVGGAPTRLVKTDSALVPFAGDTAALSDRATAFVSLWRRQAAPGVLEVSPVDPSGDAAVTYRYYFDVQGRTRGVDVRGATFHSGCTDVLRVHRRVTFGERGDSVAGEQTLTDRENKPVTAMTCEIPGAMTAPRYAAYADAVKAGVAP